MNFLKPKTFQSMPKINFSNENIQYCKNNFENYINHIRQKLMNLTPTGALCLFGNQYIMGRVLSCLVILTSSFLQYLMLVSISSFFDFCVCKYVCVEFLFLFRETSVNSLEMLHILHINAKFFHALSMVTITNFHFNNEVLPGVFLTSGSLSTGFVCVGLISCLSSV